MKCNLTINAVDAGLLASVVANKLLYVAPVWSQRGLSFRINREAITRPQWLVALRISRCYRTVSSAAAL